MASARGAVEIGYRARMVMPRKLRRWTAGAVAAAVLFLQLATAAYACPMLGATAGAQAAMPCAQAMGAANSLDPAQPGLCQQHCQFGHTQQAADPATALALPGVLFTLLRVVEPPVDAGQVAAAADLARPDPGRALSILHCRLLF